MHRVCLFLKERLQINHCIVFRLARLSDVWIGPVTLLRILYETFLKVSPIYVNDIKAKNTPSFIKETYICFYRPDTVKHTFIERRVTTLSVTTIIRK